MREEETLPVDNWPASTRCEIGRSATHTLDTLRYRESRRVCASCSAVLEAASRSQQGVPQGVVERVETWDLVVHPVIDTIYEDRLNDVLDRLTTVPCVSGNLRDLEMINEVGAAYAPPAHPQKA